jgi:hypothetical protein
VYSQLLFVGLYSEPIISVFFKFLHEKAAATNYDSIQGHNYPVGISKAYIDLTNDIECQQMVDFPTRLNNTLDIRQVLEYSVSSFFISFMLACFHKYISRRVGFLR